MPLGKWAIPQAPRCHLKRHAVNRNYRNDWCDYGGDCGACESLDGTKVICSIAKEYINEGFNLKTTGWRSTRNLETFQEAEG